MRNLLIKLLFRLLDKKEVYANINEDKINDWLARQPQELGFREYVRKRDLQLLKTIAESIGQVNSATWVGQRVELLRMAQIAQQAKERKGGKIKSNKITE